MISVRKKKKAYLPLVDTNFMKFTGGQVTALHMGTVNQEDIHDLVGFGGLVSNCGKEFKIDNPRSKKRKRGSSL